MRRRTILAVIGSMILGSVMMSACSAPVTAEVVETTSGAPQVIQVQTVPTQEKTISLTSRETVEVVPDMAQISLSVRTEKKDAADCQQANTEQLSQLLEYLKSLGFEETSIETSDFSMYPRYSWANDRQTLVGYEMNTNITVNDVPMDRVGEILSDAVEQGANEINSVFYFSSQYDKAYNEALAKAIELSKSKGETLAIASGMKLGKTLNIKELSDSQQGRYVDSELRVNKTMAAAEANEDSISMEVMPGEMQVTAEISVEFELVESTENE